MSKNTGGETIVARGVRVEGDFTVDGNIIIEGEVHGTITAAGDLQIGSEAKVEADIKAENAIIAGDVRGNIQVRSKLDLLPSSRFSGDLSSQILSVGAGAQINGTIRMGVEEGGKAGKHKRSAAVEDDDAGE